MSSTTEPTTLVMTRRLADGTVEWVPLTIPHTHEASPQEAYALIDRADFEAPEDLQAQRQDNDLVVEVDGSVVLVIANFFATDGVAFYPTPDIAGGAGPFSGIGLNPSSPILAGATPSEQILWSTGSDEPEPEEVEVQAPTTEREGGSGMMIGGIGGGLALLGLAAGAGGGGGGGGSSGGGTTPPPPWRGRRACSAR